jgi:hypothetical protein
MTRFQENFAMRSRGRSAPTATGAVVGRSEKSAWTENPCRSVSCVIDPMPEDLWRLLESATRAVDEPPADRRYSVAAKFLGRLIQERKARPSE